MLRAVLTNPTAAELLTFLRGHLQAERRSRAGVVRVRILSCALAALPQV